MNLIITITFFVTLCCNENVIANTNFYELNTVTPIELAAVGRVAKLGELYDARSDKFLYLNLFNGQLSNVSITQNAETKLKYTRLNTYEEKFEALDISAELKMSILGGLIELKGSGEYFKNSKKSARTEQASLINSFSTSFEGVDLTDSSIQSLVGLKMLEEIDATHVVVGIQWGGNVFITVESTSSESKDSQSTQGSLGVKMKNIAGLIGASGNGQVNISQSEMNEMNNFSFEVIGDILPKDTPQTFIDAVKFMKSAPTLLQKSNDGKGKAMKYNLIPISILRKLLKKNIVVNSVLKSVEEATVISCVKLFDDLNKVEQKINDLVADVNKMESYLDEKKINEIKILHHNYAKYQSEVRKNLSKHLILVRSGNENVDKLEDVIQQALNQTYANDAILLKEFDHIKREISFIEDLKNKNVTVLDKNIKWNKFLVDNMNNEIYLYYYNNQLSESKEEAYKTFVKLVNSKQKNVKALFVAMNYENLNNNTQSSSKQKVSLIINGKVEVEDYVIGTQPSNATNPELWSFYHMQNQVSTLINDFNTLKQNPVPIGFIYVQLPSEKSPTEIWPWMTWNDVSSAYAGVFFRVTGGEAGSFGEVQTDNAPRLIEVNTWYEGMVDHLTDNIYNTTIPIGGWSPWIYRGIEPGNHLFTRFRMSGGEVRPAIWQFACGKGPDN